MRTIFIGLFIITLLAGIAAKKMSTSPDQMSWVGHFLNATGLKKQDQLQKSQMDQILHQFGDEKETYNEYLKDQQQYLEGSRQQMSSLSQIIKDMLDRNSNVDLLRLKELMKQYEDQSDLLIQHGKQLMEFNENQMKLNQKLAKDASLTSIISNINRDRFVQSIKDNLTRQQDLMNQQMGDRQALKDKMQQIQDQIQQAHDSASFKENPEFVEKLRSLSDKTQSVLDDVKTKQEQLKQMNQNNLVSMDTMKQKMEDLKQKTQDAVNRSNNSSDQMRDLQQQVRDQLERSRDQRIK